MGDSLAFDVVAPELHGRFGTPYLYEPEVESTQLLLQGSDLPEGAVAATEHQTGGHGRLGRSWDEPAGSSVLVSVLLRPPAELFARPESARADPGLAHTVRRLPELSLVAAVAVAIAVEETTGLSAQVKWPNDVMLNRRKIAGILSELAGGAVVVGIGLNVNQSREELPLDAPTEPGSLRSLTGVRYDRAAVLGLILLRLEELYDGWRGGGLDGVYGELGSRDFLRGRTITLNGERATAIQIRRDGTLELETEAGEVRSIESGEILFER